MRRQPTITSGITITLAGALLGGVLGIAVDARRPVHAAAAAHVEASAPVQAVQIIAPVVVPLRPEARPPKIEAKAKASATAHPVPETKAKAPTEMKTRETKLE